DSVAEWGNELLALDHLVVEGFIERKLRQLATENGAAPEKDWRSLKILEVTLQAMGMTEVDARATVAPLRELHNLRNPAKAHGDPVGREAAVRDARATYGSLRAHTKDLAARCDTSMMKIISVLTGNIETGD
ncbi:MAG: hypothetical protein RLN72_00750, partial [Henriciella sp.]